MRGIASLSVGPSPGRPLGLVGLGLMAAGAGVMSLVLSTGTSLAGGGGGLAPLSSVATPLPTGGQIVNQRAAVQLGKALFWDVQVGGDGRQACASCHDFAGEDTRMIDTVSPGPDVVFASESVTGPGQAIARVSGITNDDRLGSAGGKAGSLPGAPPRPAA